MIKRAKSIQEIYEEVKAYSLVLTVDAPLRTALDKMLKKPMLGTWAMTPKELAVKYAPRTINRSVISKSDAIIEISNRLDMNIKQAYYHADMIYNLWEIFGNPDKINDFLGDEGRSVLDLLKDFPTVHLAMSKFNRSLIDKGKVAVIGLEYFTELDKLVLPHDFTEIDIFKNEDYVLSNFYAFSGENDLVDRIVSMITNENADDLAIVLNPEASYLPLIRSKIRNKGIPVTIKEYLKDHFQVRDFLALVNLGLNHTNLTVKEIAHFAGILPFYIDADKHNFLLSEYMALNTENQRLTEFHDLLNSITNKTYKELIDWLSDKKISLPYELSDIIRQISIMDKTIDLESYADLAYCIENLDIEIDTNKSGVLLISCKNSAYIDRPVCIYIGLDTSWDRTSMAELIDSETEEKKEIDLFQILLQQGTIRYYLVSTMKDNQPVIPCYYFNILFGREIGSFISDPIFKAQRIRNSDSFCPDNNSDEKKPFILSRQLKDAIDAEKNDFPYFSQSTLNSFATCPKKYMYNKLTPSEQQEYLTKGTLFHSFASFYLTYPEVVMEKGIDFFVDQMTNEYKKMVDDIILDIERSKFKIGLQNLRFYIDSLIIEKDIRLAFQTESKNKNRFAELLGLSDESTNAELRFEDDEMHLDGVFDLMVNNVTIVDHKSGDKPKSTSEIIREADIHPKKGRLDFQAKLYILEMRRNNPNDIEFIYDYFLSNHRDVIDGKSDTTGDLVTIKYYHKEFNEFITTDEGIDIIAGTSKKRAEIIAKIGYDNIIRFFMDNPIPREMQFDDDILLNSDYCKNFCDYMLGFVSSRSKTILEQISDILKGIVMIRNATARGLKKAYFFKDDIDEFEVFLSEKYNDILSYIDDNFPFKPINRDSCDECDYADICLKWYET
ncbi:MAG: PD-(D/E)XK nuclease family protein [Candidatus Poribacteria bacterium]